MDELYGRLIPSVSMAEAMVLAVYIPPQAPAPGQACRSTWSISPFPISFERYFPYDSKADTISSFCPFRLPGRIVPPYTMIDGRFTRAIAITDPGMFLSQPTTEIFPSYHWALITVSMESAMISLEGRENFMPWVPMEIPSLTPTECNTKPTRSYAHTLFFMIAARSFRCILHGLPSQPVLAIPI